MKVDFNDGDALLDFMHPKEPFHNFYQPKNFDQIWRSLDHIICCESSPAPHLHDKKFTLKKN